MGSQGKSNIVLSLLLVGVVGSALAAFLFLGPPKLLAKSESPDFCVSCHVMESEYESWIHTGAHRRKMCVDCHLPNGNAGVHYLWKSIDGLKDVLFFYSGRAPEHIRITAHGTQVLQANCIRCHEQLVSGMDHERQCWSCHRRISHKRSGAIETL
jgi:cytochrome c nitrite reductase small subunit